MKIGSEEWKNIIIQGAKVFDVNVGLKEVEQFSIHAVELLKWNLKINLTAITDPFEVAVKHFLDSIASAGIIPAGSSMLDIGSGGGFPGIPLKIIIPNLSLTLLDSSRKKITFLKHVIRTIGIENIEALQVRAEELAQGTKMFDVIICRAFSSLEQYVGSALPLLAPDGLIISLKGKIDPVELQSIRVSDDRKQGNGKISGLLIDIKIKKYFLPYIDSERTLIIIKKLR
ncbi:MAG: 16S rRNA (guanine(527)-N(7))-methyltransferase RsmG [Desulfobacteraceae bacterium]|nr:MAG: 16S rRNA (guanine(527)-N(7))-methyltransferase RsmG [Desulfobacteraceae bacterium]